MAGLIELLSATKKHLEFRILIFFDEKLFISRKTNDPSYLFKRLLSGIRRVLMEVSNVLKWK